MEDLGSRIESALRDRPEVRVALLFGSRAEGREAANSDVDLAIDGEELDPLELARLLSESLELECDVVDLADVGYPLKKALLDRGRLVYERQAGDGAQWRSWTIAEVETDRPWFERMRNAPSCTTWRAAMVDADLIAAKLGELRRRTGRIRQHRRDDAADLAADRDALDLVSFNLMLAVQSCLDVASHIIADEGWEPARTLADSFRRLAARGVIADPVAEALGRAAALRNVVAHGYSGADPERIHAAAHEGVKDLESFGAAVSTWVRKRVGDDE